MNTFDNNYRTKLPALSIIIGIALFALLFLLPKQALANQYDPCPSGTGPEGIKAGDYDPTTLTQEKRQWLFEIFGNAGIAPVGYGGQQCVERPSQYSPCPAGTGPDGITAGDYDPNTLSQEKKQWLFEVFGNVGIAPVGYGGQRCGLTLPTLRVMIPQYSQQVEAYDWPMGSTLTLTIYDPAISLTDPVYTTTQVVTQVTPWDPNRSYARFDLEGVYDDIQRGFVVNITDGVTLKSLTVSSLIFTNMDILADTVTGIAKPNARVDIWICDEYGSCFNRHVVADNNGKWLADWSKPGTEPDEQNTFDLVYWTFANSSEPDTDGDLTGFGLNAPCPYISVMAYEDRVEPIGWPMGSTLTMIIDDPSTGDMPDYTYTKQVLSKVPWQMDLTFVSFDLNGIFDIQPGFVIEVTDGTITRTHTVTPFKFTGMDVDADTIEGVANPYGHIKIWACDDTWNCFDRFVVADSNGKWSADWSIPGTRLDEQNTFDIIFGTWANAAEQDSAGNLSYYGDSAPNPHNDVRANTDQVMTYDWWLNDAITLEIDHPETTNNPDYSETRIVAGYTPWDPNTTYLKFNLQGIFDIQPGDIIRLTDGFNIKPTTVSSLAFTNISIPNNTVSGIASSNTRINIWACDRLGNCANRHADADNIGNWEVNFSQTGTEENEQTTIDLADVTCIDSSESYGTTGDSTFFGQNMPNPRLEISPYSDWIHAYEWPIDTVITMTIDDPSNGIGADYSEIATVEFNPGDPNVLADFRWPDQFTPGPGYIITMSGDNGQSETYTVPNLKVTDIDLENDTISGTASPNTAVTICINTYYPQDNCAWRTVTADVSGNWTADYKHEGSRDNEKSTFDIQGGTAGWADEYDADGDRTWFDWWVPVPIGTISGTVKDLNGNPITGYSIGVTVTTENNDALSSTCTDPATGQYTVTDVPQNIPAKIVAGETQCGSHPYGIEYWQHATNNLPPELITLTESAPDLTGIDFNLGSFVSSMEFFIFNFNNPIVTDPAVRQAIAFGTDREGILNEAFLPNGEFGGIVQNTYIPQEHWAKAPNSALTLYPYDPVQARAILSAAGWIDTNGDGIREKDGQRLTLNFKTTLRPSRVASGDIFQQNMADIGIEIITEYIDAGTFFGVNGTVEAGDFDIAEYTSGSCASAEDETCLADAMFLGGDPSNTGHYSNAQADLEFHAIQAATTRADKLTHSIQHQAIISQDLAVLPLFTRGQDVEPVDTPIGDDVSIDPTPWLTIQFEQVDQAGVASAVETNFTPEDLPGGFQLIGTVYEIGTTAQFTRAQVCFNYDDSGLSSEEESHLKLYHQKNLEWVNVTDADYPNTSANLICGTVDSFSPFAIMFSTKPAILTITAPVDPRQINTTVNATATFMDPDLNDNHTAIWDWGDGQTSAGTVIESNQTVSGNHAYTSAGVYTVQVTVTDATDASASASFSYVVVYDPTGGFVTGGGWFTDPDTGSKVHFGFNPKYQKNTTIPKGETEFKLSGLTFKSTSHDWLVINGAKAQFKGSGTINGAGDYGFLVTVIDGSPDKIRIKIWDKEFGEEFYDNQPGAADYADPTTPIGGGSIQIHAK